MSLENPQTGYPPMWVAGAYEDFEGKREELYTLVRTRLLQPGDQLPEIPGIELGGQPFILHTVNALGTETCDECVDTLEQFTKDHPEIPVYTLTKQNTDEFYAEHPDAKKVGQKVLRITDTVAADLGVGLVAGENADPDFWPTALRRTLAAVDANGKIIDIQQPDDQEEKPDFLRAYAKVLASE